jgi:hypothetical protein
MTRSDLELFSATSLQIGPSLRHHRVKFSRLGITLDLVVEHPGVQFVEPLAQFRDLAGRQRLNG